MRIATASMTFSGNGTQTLPIVSIIRFYVTGWGLKGGAALTVSDPYPGSTPPADMATPTTGFYFWGHVLP